MDVGIDACRGGWVAVCLHPGAPARARFAPTLSELGAAIPHARAFAVDIPIGLPAEGRRPADLDARALLGPRRSSVFLTPVRAALEAPTYHEATRISARRTGHGISRQAYALRPKILEAERWRHEVRAPVREVHPELTFSVLLGRPAGASKRTWAGMVERRRALEAAGIDLDDLGDAGARAGVDDVLDAAAAAWSARRIAQGRAISVPDPPPPDPDTGEPVAIWA